MKRLFVAALATVAVSSCAHSSVFGQPSEHDVICGHVGSITVRIREDMHDWPGNMECGEALFAVANNLDAANVELKQEWTVIFTGGYAGAYMDRNMQLQPADGMTYTRSRVIEVRGNRTFLLTHEFGHAYDTEHHLTNHRDNNG